MPFHFGKIMQINTQTLKFFHLQYENTIFDVIAQKRNVLALWHPKIPIPDFSECFPLRCK